MTLEFPTWCYGLGVMRIVILSRSAAEDKNFVVPRWELSRVKLEILRRDAP